jgi:hypothetical protein
VGQGGAGSGRIGQLTSLGVAVERRPRRQLLSRGERGARRTTAARLIAGCCLAIAALHAQPALEEGQPPPFVETPPGVVDRMLGMAKLGPQDILIDLGSGDGRIVIQGAKRGARGLGIEMNADLVEVSRALALRAGVAERAKFERGDALAADLAAATVLTLYLSPELNERLLPRILGTMRPGSRVVSHDFAISNWAPDQVERLTVPEKNNGRGGESTVMLWIVPANAAGRWRATIGAGAARRSFEFSLAQQFQKLEGALHGARELHLFKARLAGDRIDMDLAANRDTSLRGAASARISNETMTGEWHVPGERDPVPFEARRIRARPDLY